MEENRNEKKSLNGWQITAIIVLVLAVAELIVCIIFKNMIAAITSLISNVLISCLLFGISNLLQRAEILEERVSALESFHKPNIKKEKNNSKLIECEACFAKLNKDVIICPNCGYNKNTKSFD